MSERDKDYTNLKAQILQQAFTAVGIELDTLLKIGIEEACIFVEGKAAALAPVDTGMLRKSITHRIIDRVGYPVGQVGTSTEYAAYLEFGTGIYAKNGDGRKTPWAYKNDNGKVVWTHGNKPQPFLTPALNTSRSSIKRIIEQRLKTAL